MEKTTAKPCFPGKHYLAEGVPLPEKDVEVTPPHKSLSLNSPTDH